MKCKAHQELCRSDRLSDGEALCFVYARHTLSQVRPRNSFGIRSYKKCARKPFRMRNSKIIGLKAS